MNKINIGVKLPVSIIREGKKYIAYTPALDLSTSGRNYQEAKKRFSEIVGIFFEEIVNKKTLDAVLRDLGWQKVQEKWNPPLVISCDFEEVKL